MDVVLASASPRRKRLLSRLVGKIRCLPARISERILPGESYAKACARLAKAKADFAAKRAKGALVIGADTIAYRGKRAYRKTASAKAARQILAELSGKTHIVSTGVAVVFPGGKSVKFAARAVVGVKKLSPSLLEWYLKSGEWKGRTGCYDVSGKGARLIASVKGERETVAGLPLLRLGRLLASYRGKKPKGLQL